jgi:serine/threonine protein kinase
MTAEERPTPSAGEDDTGEVRVVGGKYRLGRVLGQGGMGIVYEAENTWTGRRVALKVLDPGAVADAVQVSRFMEEARVTAALRHPNIVDVLDMGQDPADGALFIVHELLAGEDLRAHLAREPRLDVDRALDLLGPALRGLAAAHAAGVVHRDVKPANLFLARGADGEVVPKVIDFGVARDLTRDDRRLRTGTGESVGTPAYMAPEQLRGDRAITPSADVWAVGVVLHQMLAGAPPFPADNHHVLVHRVLAGERAPTDITLAHVPVALRAVVDRCLDADPTRRFASAADLLDALDATRRAPVVPPSASAPTRPARRGRIVALLAVLAATVGAAALTARRPRHAAITAPPAAFLRAPVPTVPTVPAVPAARPSPVVAVPPTPAPPLVVDHASRAHLRHAPVAAPDASSNPPRTRAALLTPGGAYPSP